MQESGPISRDIKVYVTVIALGTQQAALTAAGEEAVLISSCPCRQGRYSQRFWERNCRSNSRRSPGMQQAHRADSLFCCGAEDCSWLITCRSFCLLPQTMPLLRAQKTKQQAGPMLRSLLSNRCE